METPDNLNDFGSEISEFSYNSVTEIGSISPQTPHETASTDSGQILTTSSETSSASSSPGNIHHDTNLYTLLLEWGFQDLYNKIWFGKLFFDLYLINTCC